jgi:hypothetical protein
LALTIRCVVALLAIYLALVIPAFLGTLRAVGRVPRRTSGPRAPAQILNKAPDTVVAAIEDVIDEPS